MQILKISFGFFDFANKLIHCPLSGLIIYPRFDVSTSLAMINHCSLDVKRLFSLALHY